jgi:hypothetical protein
VGHVETGDLPITARGLACLLTPLNVRAGQFKVGGRNVRGYRREAFADAIKRYLPWQAGPRDLPTTGVLISHDVAGPGSLPSPASGTHKPSEIACLVPLPHVHPRDTTPASHDARTDAADKDGAVAPNAGSPTAESAGAPRSLVLVSRPTTRIGMSDGGRPRLRNAFFRQP